MLLYLDFWFWFSILSNIIRNGRTFPGTPIPLRKYQPLYPSAYIWKSIVLHTYSVRLVHTHLFQTSKSNQSILTIIWMLKWIMENIIHFFWMSYCTAMHCDTLMHPALYPHSLVQSVFTFLQLSLVSPWSNNGLFPLIEWTFHNP